MERLTKFEFQGETYFLNFSVNAACLINAKYEDMNGFQEATENVLSKAGVEAVLWAFGILVEEGRQYMLLKEQVEIPKLEAENMEHTVCINEVYEMQTAIIQSFTKSIARTVEAKPPKKKEKTTQGNNPMRGFGFMEGFWRSRKRS